MGDKEKEVKGFWLLYKDRVIKTGVQPDKVEWDGSRCSCGIGRR